MGLRFFGLLAMGLAVWFAATVHGSAFEQYLFDLPSLLAVSGLTLGYLVFKHGRHGILFWTHPAIKNRAKIAEEGGKMCIKSGWFGFLCGAMISLDRVSDLSHIGPSLAMSLVTVFYGYLGYFFFFKPFEDMSNKELEVNKLAAPVSLAILFAVVVGYPFVKKDMRKKPTQRSISSIEQKHELPYYFLKF